MATTSHNEGSIRQRANGRFEVRVTIDGKQKSFYAETMKEAKELRRQIIAKRDAGAVVIADRQTTVAKYMTQWLTTKVEIRPRTHERYEGEIRNHIIPAIGTIKLANLTRQHLIAFYEDKRRSGLAKSSVDNIHRVICTALNDAVSDEILPRNVAARIKGMKKTRTETAHWTAEQARTFLAAIEGDPLELFYVLALTTGMRRGEILALHWRDVDFKKGVLTVKYTLRAGKAGKFYFERPKTDAGMRQIPLPKMTVNLLNRTRRAEKVVSMVGDREGSQHTDLIFKTASGNPQRGNHILQRQFYPLCQRLGLPAIRLHDLRHTCASLLYEMGYQDVDIAKLLGHSNPSVTREIYIHTRTERLRDASDRLGDLLNTKMG